MVGHWARYADQTLQPDTPGLAETGPPPCKLGRQPPFKLVLSRRACEAGESGTRGRGRGSSTGEPDVPTAAATTPRQVSDPDLSRASKGRPCQTCVKHAPAD